jgi:tripeptide aminopeptidase
MAAASARALDLFLDLARLQTPTGRERAAADHCAAYLGELGIEVAEDDAGPGLGSDAGNLYCRIPATGPGEPIFLCAHLDTVPVAAPIEPEISDGVVRNANAGILGADNKASVAGMLDGVRRVLAAGDPHPGIELVLTIREETGLQGAKAFDLGRLEARCGLVYDHAATIGGVVMAAPGQNTVRLAFEGQAAHAGIAPEQGRSAIAAAARAIAGMRLGRIDDETTANVGTIEGGQARNVVPGQCLVEAEVRSRDVHKLAEETAAMLAAAAAGAAAEDCRLESDVRQEYAAYRLRRSDPVVQIARSALEACGHAVREEAVGGGADANVFNAAGVPCVVLASGMQDVHTPGEWIRAGDVDALSDLTVAAIAAAAAR